MDQQAAFSLNGRSTGPPGVARMADVAYVVPAKPV
jgi:hypothetical protein